MGGQCSRKTRLSSVPEGPKWAAGGNRCIGMERSICSSLKKNTHMTAENSPRSLSFCRPLTQHRSSLPHVQHLHSIAPSQTTISVARHVRLMNSPKRRLGIRAMYRINGCRDSPIERELLFTKEDGHLWALADLSRLTMQQRELYLTCFFLSSASNFQICWVTKGNSVGCPLVESARKAFVSEL